MISGYLLLIRPYRIHSDDDRDVLAAVAFCDLLTIRELQSGCVAIGKAKQSISAVTVPRCVLSVIPFGVSKPIYNNEEAEDEFDVDIPNDDE